MAKVISTIFLIISSILVATPNGNQVDNALFQSICQGKEKVAKLHFYVHGNFTGPNQNSFEIARSSITSTSQTLFGKVLVVDDLLTIGPDINSEKLGRGQGFATAADLATMAYAMNFNLVFTYGKYNGSTLSLTGRNQIMNKEREFSIVGGTGIFRFARGYTIERSILFNADREFFDFTVYVAYPSVRI